MDWQSIAKRKRASLLALIPRAWRLKDSDIPSIRQLHDVVNFICRWLNPLEIQITNATSDVILHNVQSMHWSAIEVTRAFCHRASIAHQLTNCLSEICFEAAEKRAEELDTFIRKYGQTVGPLHGLPISLKDRFHVNGLDSACGFISWIGNPKNEADEGVLVTRLRQAGAIIFVKTNVPASMLIGETTNNIIGSTVNPFNRNLTAGGASGGEGALLALRGSPVGWGSDIAGSVRIPCAFNNLYGLRPSFGRISASGLATSLPGLPIGMSVVGPMSTDLESLITILKWIVNCKSCQDDFEVIDLPWSQERWESGRNRICQPGKQDGSLVFGIMKTDGEVNPHPPVQRAMDLVSEALHQRGYETVDWSPPAHSPAADTFFQILGSTAGQAIRDAIKSSNEPPIPQLAGLFHDESLEPLSTTDFWRLCQMREEFRRQYHEYWRSTSELTSSKRPVDGVILPIAAHPPPSEGSFKYYAYSAIPSVLDFTTGSVPVTFADRSLDFEVLAYEPMTAKDRANWHLYQKELFDGAPIGVQVMGQRLQEEKVLAMMEAVTSALQEYRRC